MNESETILIFDHIKCAFRFLSEMKKVISNDRPFAITSDIYYIESTIYVHNQSKH